MKVCGWKHQVKLNKCSEVMHAGCSKQCCGLETQVHFVKISVSRPDGQGLGLKTLTRYLTYWWTEYRLLMWRCRAKTVLFIKFFRVWCWMTTKVLVLRPEGQDLGLGLETWCPRSWSPSQDLTAKISGLGLETWRPSSRSWSQPKKRSWRQHW